MRPGLSSKHPKKNADEDRSKKKKMKSDKRRRHDSSSSSSYSSDTEIDARSRKKSSRREPKKREKRRKEPKKLVKKKSRKTCYRGDFSASSPSLSCSTCRGRSSSSGWSESDSARSRKARLKGRNRSRSPDRVVRRVKSRNRSRSKGRERGRSRRCRQKRSYERDDGKYRLRSCSSCESSSSSSSSHSSRSYSRIRNYSEGKGKEVGQLRRHKSALVVTKESERMKGLRSRDKIVQACDDVGKNLDAHEDGQVELGGAKNADVACDDSTRKNSGNSGNAGNSESEDLELVLRQKALENFRKFRGGLSVNTSTGSDQKDEPLLAESCKDAGGLVEAKDAIISSKWKSKNNYLDRPGSIQRGSRMSRPRIRSVVNIPTENDDGNSVIGRENASESSGPAVDPITMSATGGQATSNHLNIKEGPLDLVSSGKTLLPKDFRNKKTAAEPCSSTPMETEMKIADGSTSGASTCLNVESGNKPVEVDATGSHFEQRTFSRMHDGEMVQVSYKVYIPKKSPALARRQLPQ